MAAAMSEQQSGKKHNNSNTDASQADLNTSEVAGTRKRIAQQLPFIVRAWWLRDYPEFRDIPWRKEPYITGPLWSAYSDPGCDMAGLDYSYDVEEE